MSSTHADSPANVCSHQWPHHVQSDCIYLSFLAPALHADIRFLGSSVKIGAQLYSIWMGRFEQNNQRKLVFSCKHFRKFQIENFYFNPCHRDTQIKRNSISKWKAKVLHENLIWGIKTQLCRTASEISREKK